MSHAAALLPFSYSTVLYFTDENMCCMSNKALGVGSRHHTTLGFAWCCMGLLTKVSGCTYSLLATIIVAMYRLHTEGEVAQ